MVKNNPRLLVAYGPNGYLTENYGNYGVQPIVMVRNYRDTSPVYESFTLVDDQYKAEKAIDIGGMSLFSAADIAKEIGEMVKQKLSFDVTMGSGEDTDSLKSQMAFVEFYHGNKVIVGAKVYLFHPVLTGMPSIVFALLDNEGHNVSTYKVNKKTELVEELVNEIRAEYEEGST